MKLGPKEAAAVIRGHVEAAVLPPEESHMLRFLQQVAAELGLDHTVPENLHKVAAALKHSDIDIHEGHEYPKWVGENATAKIVNSAEEEKAYLASLEPKPEHGHEHEHG